jgi:hypothetical protein
MKIIKNIIFLLGIHTFEDRARSTIGGHYRCGTAEGFTSLPANVLFDCKAEIVYQKSKEVSNDYFARTISE